MTRAKPRRRKVLRHEISNLPLTSFASLRLCAKQIFTPKPTGNPGEAKLHCDAVPHAVSYESRAALDLDAPVWVPGPPATKIRQLLFTGLERGKDWNFEIRAIGPNGPSPRSDVARMMVV